jgi:diaminopimelate decarboxylase
MRSLNYRNGRLFAGDTAMDKIAMQFGTPLYVYSRSDIEHQWSAYDKAFAGRNHLICYAVKANSNLAVLNVLARLGSGFDIVSEGELERVLQAGGRPERIVFSGVGKTAGEITRALETGIKCLNCESISELRRIDRLAGNLDITAPVSLRINPDVDAATHPYIATGLNENKFGIAWQDALSAYEIAASMEHIRITGIACHIGSQITSMSPYLDAINRIKALMDQLGKLGIKLEHIDIGGGLGICYQQETPPDPAAFTRSICAALPDNNTGILLEPGRSIVGNAGILLTRVEYLKQNCGRNFAIIDAAMNDLLRPALYSSWQDVLPLQKHNDTESMRYDLVGPVCESGDFIALDRTLALQEGDLLAVCSAGAYGFCMSSNYNTRPRVAEVMLDGNRMHQIRKRETIAELMSGESLLPE